ncbi:hypothetical protein EVJ58_g873 [Rhodofomes roseus]|uniref:Uncharacterized protein n=1 Tax=Rhodofomes roseus TaxID=34475 RepID=A0A4Y9Z4G5_9APHY|nr:hypothetical protein EVJ58_g873 [Rhodofomes roseus]
MPTYRLRTCGAYSNSSASIRANPVVALESFHLRDQTTPLFTPRISGKITHQFLMISVDFRTYPPEHHPWTYLRIDFDEDPFPNGSQLVALSDDYDDLRGYSKGLGRIAAPDQPVENGPSLDDIVSLLEVVHGHTFGGYTCFSRMWLTESILLSAALKHAQHWSSGYVRPKALRRYAELESDVATCTTGILYHDPVMQALAGPGLRALRSVSASFTQSHPNRVEVHDEDIRVILEEWQPSVQARFI